MNKEEKKESTDSRIIKGLFAGMAAGALCGLVYQPLDVVKTNLILLPKNYEIIGKNSFEAIRDITKMVHAEAGWKGFWMGTSPAAVRSSMSCAIYFSLLRLFNNISRKKIQVKKRYVSDFIDSGLARVLTSIITNPLNVLKTQWALLEKGKPNQRLFHSLVEIIQSNRSKIFVMGSFPMICEEFLYGGIFNVIYEGLNRTEHLENRIHKYFLAFTNGILAGMVGAILTQPFEIARIKIQSQKTHWHPANGKNLTMAALVYVYKRYGWTGFTRGFVPRFLKKTLMSASSFSIYEFLRQRKFEE